MEREDATAANSQAPSKKDTIYVPDDALYRFLVESLSDYAVFAVSASGDIITWNTGAEKTYGYTKRDVVGRSFKVTFTADDVAAGDPERELLEAHNGRRFTYERWNVRKDGTRFLAANNMAPISGDCATAQYISVDGVRLRSGVSVIGTSRR